MSPHLTDKVNEAIASPARFREQAQGIRKVRLDPSDPGL